MAPDPVSVDLNGLVIDGETLDLNGNIWRATSVEGWWDTAPNRSALSEVPEGGQVLTVVATQARPVALEVICRKPFNGERLGELGCFLAREVIKRYGNARNLPVPLLVTDPFLALQAQVRLAQPIKTRIDGDCGFVTAQVPLICPDPRRYDQTEQVVTLDPGTTVVTNNGDEPTPVLLEVTDTNPSFQNLTAAGAPILAITGSGAVSIDSATEEVLIGGTPSRSSLTTAQWWQLVPGPNTIDSTGGTITFRDAYS